MEYSLAPVRLIQYDERMDYPRICNTCGVIKPLREFKLGLPPFGGHSIQCLECYDRSQLDHLAQEEREKKFRVCRTCDTEKPITEFKGDKTCTHGYRHQCRVCYRKLQNERYQRDKDNPEFIRKKRISGRKCDLKRNYGITEEEYDKLLKAQDFKCAICEKTEEKSGRKLSVDHCHTSNNIRGVLCTACNTALGKFKDDVHLLEMAIKYLKEHKALITSNS